MKNFLFEHDGQELWYSHSLACNVVIFRNNGKAVYIEEVNVVLDENGDTLYNYSTYRLEWLPEWKYGRKHERD